jgi:hypothetical protein
MASQAHDQFAPRRSFVADADIAKHMPVQLSSYTNNESHVAPFTSGTYIGVASRDCQSGDMVDVILYRQPTLVMGYVAASGGTAITQGAILTAGATGFAAGLAPTGATNAIALEPLSSGKGFIEALLS